MKTISFVCAVALASAIGPAWSSSEGSVLGAPSDPPITTPLPKSNEEAVAADLADESLLIRATRAGERIVAVGKFGHIMLSDDNGETWRQSLDVPTRVMLTDVAFATDQIGWAVGHDQAILKTTDGGESWTKQFDDPGFEAPFLTVRAVDADTALAFGAFTTAYQTSDGGETWDQLTLVDENSDVSVHLNQVFTGPGNAIFIAAEFGNILRSTDGGATYDVIETGYQGSFWGGMGLESGDLLIYGMRGNVWRSGDGGDTWSPVQTGTNESFSGGAQLEDGSILLAGLGGALSLSTDGGRSFATTIRKERSNHSDILDIPGPDALVFGEDGVTRFTSAP
ncbi:MAG: YCF48-related protein [Pseudomonadota bacterium]